MECREDPVFRPPDNADDTAIRARDQALQTRVENDVVCEDVEGRACPVFRALGVAA